MSDWPENRPTGVLVAYAVLYGSLFIALLVIFIGIGAETGIGGNILGLILMAVLYPFVGMIFFQVVKELRRRTRDRPHA
jgi:hypothetical protein